MAIHNFDILNILYNCTNNNKQGRLVDEVGFNQPLKYVMLI